MVNGPNQISKEANAPYWFSLKERERLPHSTLKQSYTPTPFYLLAPTLQLINPKPAKIKRKRKKKIPKTQSHSNSL